MSGGWAGSDRGARLPADWPQLVGYVRRRAAGRCEQKIPGRNGGRFRCSSQGTDCDHIIPGDNHDPSNLQWLCPRHHLDKSSAEGNAAKAAIKSKGKRPPEQHPGLIRRH